MNTCEYHSTHNSRTQRLLARYGELMSLKDVAVELKYTSTQAVLDARRRNMFPVVLTKMPKRRSLFAQTCAVAQFLNVAFPVEESPSQHDEENTNDVAP